MTALRDITERKLAEEALRESKAMLENMPASSSLRRKPNASASPPNCTTASVKIFC